MSKAFRMAWGIHRLEPEFAPLQADRLGPVSHCRKHARQGLDVGCGGGKTVSKLAALAIEGKVFGIDYAYVSVPVARKLNGRHAGRDRRNLLGSADQNAKLAEKYIPLVGMKLLSPDEQRAVFSAYRDLYGKQEGWICGSARKL